MLAINMENMKKLKHIFLSFSAVYSKSGHE